MILVIGQIAARDLRREAFQEIDYQKMFGSIAKWVFECTGPEQIAQAAFKAIRMATSGVPGPVVLVLPEDIQQQTVPVPTFKQHPHVFGLPAADTLAARGISTTVADARFAKPVDADLLRDLISRGIPVLTVEDHSIRGGFGSCVLEACADLGLDTRLVTRLALPDHWIYQGERREQLIESGLDAASIARAIRTAVAAAPSAPRTAAARTTVPASR
jgi:hypothetical protein